MRKSLSLITLAFMLSFGSPEKALAKDDLSKKLQQAVDFIPKNPQKAAALLTHINSAGARAYLAYLYLSGDVKTDNKNKKVRALMRSASSAIANLPDSQSMAPQHYQSMGDILSAIRLIDDAEGTMITVPAEFFQKYPDEAFEAYASLWGSTRDSFLAVDTAGKDGYEKIPAVKKYVRLLDQLFGAPRSDCQGTIRYMWYRRQALANIKAALVPQQFARDLKTKEGSARATSMDHFIETWGNQELWNYQKEQELKKDADEAEAPLANYFAARYKWPKQRAIEIARATLTGFRIAYLDNYSESDVEETRKNVIYQVFSRKGLTLADLKHGIGDRSLTKEELTLALRLASLNGAQIEVFDFLIEKGAPLAGGAESPLSTAVLRPDVTALLIKNGADIKEHNRLGKTALIQAAQYNALPSIKDLVAAGADINHKMCATDSKEAEEANATCEVNYGVGNRTALMYACAFADPETITWLVQNGGDITAKDSEGKTAVNFLSWNEKLTMAQKAELLKNLTTKTVATNQNKH